MLPRKHYEAIAHIIYTSTQHTYKPPEWNDGYKSSLIYLANNLATYFELDNPNFDRKWFLKAAGVSDI